MTFCCGEMRDTKFCPECGAAVRRHDRASLLKYLERQHKIQHDRLQGAMEKLDKLAKEGCEVTDVKYRNAQKSERVRRHLTAKYDAWIEAVKGIPS